MSPQIASASCLDVEVTSQGETVEAALENLREHIRSYRLVRE